MKKWSVVAILALAQFVMVLDSTVMNVSISQVVADLNTSVSALQAAITFYTLTMAAFMLTGAKLGDKLGLLKSFVIGSIIYGLGSFLTGISQNVTTLFIGWSVIEGIGAVLVIPAIAALVATNYRGKDRVTAFAIIGGISGAAAAAGPLIGGYMTTYLSWRYVFIAETVIMLIVLLLSRRFQAPKPAKAVHIDIPSVLLSASGMALLVYGMLQSKVWGWIIPMAKPTIAGREVAPFGISMSAYLILAGSIVLYLFIDRQRKLETTRRSPLLRVSMFAIKQLRSGLAVLMSQYLITAAVFFVVPIFLQMVLGLDALQTGLKILPLSLALIIFSVIGTRLAANHAPRRIVRLGQILLVLGSVALLAAIGPQLTGYAFWAAMFAVGAGLGLLASQLGNINMSAVSESQTSEVGGLQGTFQNLGSSFGTALIGSMMILSLTSVFVANINAAPIDPQIKQYITEHAQAGVPIVPANQVEAYAVDKGVPADQAAQISQSYVAAELTGLRQAIFVLLVVAILSIALSRHIPNSKPNYSAKKA